MAQCAWNEGYSVGDAVLDSDHRILISVMGQLHEAVDTGQSRDVVGSVLNVLADYAEHHFRREEDMLAAAGFPELDDHRAQHGRMMATMRAMRERYQAGDSGILGEEVLALINKWLTDHIMVSDKSYKPWLERTSPRAGVGGAQG